MRRLIATSALSALAAGMAVAIVFSALGIGPKTTVIEPGPTATPAAQERALTFEAIYRQTVPGIVQVSAQGGSTGSPFGFRGRQPDESLGTGFVVDSTGRIITNAHVVGDASSVAVTFADNNSRTAQVVGENNSTDIAVLKVNPRGLTLHPLALGNSQSLQVGDTVLAIGNPLGFNSSLTTGVVSSLGRQIQAPNGAAINDAIQIDAALNPGNSGGPLLDAAGQVVGVNSQIATGDASGQQDASGIGFAVPINTAKRALS